MERRLGRGLGSLLSDRDTPKDNASSTHDLPISSIRPNPFQPRKHFDAEGLDELKESIRVHGVMQPVVVRKVGAIHELVAGERRWRASQLVGLTRIPAVVREGVSDDQMLELALVENLQRRDLDPIERARGFRLLLDRLGSTQDEVAERVGLKRTTITNHLRLLELPTPVQEALIRGTLSMGHAKAILGLADATERVAMASRAVEQGLSVREVENLVRGGAGPGRAPSEAPKPERSSGDPGQAAEAQSPPPPWAATLEARLQEALGTRVELRLRGDYRGQVQIHFYDREDLDRLLEQLAPAPSL
jgi:ParB family transcriptional regulator, chromosome partitioning protein